MSVRALTKMAVTNDGPNDSARADDSPHSRRFHESQKCLMIPKYLGPHWPTLKTHLLSSNSLI